MSKNEWMKHLEAVGVTNKAELLEHHRSCPECPECKARTATRRRNRESRERNAVMRDMGMTRVVGPVTGSVYWE